MSAEPKRNESGLLAKVVPHADKLRRYLSHRLRAQQDVDDLAQEVYLRLLRRNDAAQVADPIKYLYGVAAKVVADFFTDATYEREHVMTDSDELTRVAERLEESSAVDSSEQLVEEQRLERALHKLPGTQAMVLVLHEVEGLSYAEVAARLGLSLHTVEKYLVKAKAHLRVLLWCSEHERRKNDE
jgi:RNA polymerase sigma-19 factor, ECF subfamily